MRRTIHQRLITTPALTALIPSERWFQAGAVRDVPPALFAVVRWLSPVAGEARGSFIHLLRIDVHGPRGSYAPIEAVLGDPSVGGGIWAALAPLTDYVGVDGRITCTDFLGNSGDQEDEVYKTNYKSSSWNVIGRRL